MPSFDIKCLYVLDFVDKCSAKALEFVHSICHYPITQTLLPFVVTFRRLMARWLSRTGETKKNLDWDASSDRNQVMTRRKLLYDRVQFAMLHRFFW